MTRIEGIFIWLSIAGYVLGLGAYWVGWLFKKGAGMNWGWRVTIAAFLLQNAAIVARWQGVGHPPVMGTYESSLTGSWFLVILFFASSRWVKDLRPVGSIVLPVVLLLLGNGINSRPALEPLAPPSQSNWLWVHVAFAWLAFGSYVLCAAMGAIYLWRCRRKASPGSFLYQKLPSQDVLDDLNLRVMAFGFLGRIW